MFIRFEKQVISYLRPSKLGQVHGYCRERTMAVIRCDNCNELFYRLKGSMSSKRLSNNYFHCCSNCDTKRFAQRKGVERRNIWDLPVSSELDISRL